MSEEKKKPKGWRKRVLTRHLGKKVYLNSTKVNPDDPNEEPIDWIIPKKIDVVAYQEMIFQDDDDEFDRLVEETKESEKDKSETEKKELEKIDKDEIKKRLKRVKRLLKNKTLTESIKIAVINGVHDHNLLDDDGEKEIWNEELYERLKEFREVIYEIYTIIMDFNLPLAKEKSKK